MKNFAKIVSAIMSAVILITALCVPASAASIEDTAKAIDNGKKISFTPDGGNIWGGKEYDYKVTLSEKGTLKLTFTTKAEKICVKVMNANGDLYEPSEAKSSTGNTHFNLIKRYTELNWNRTMEKFSGTLSYKSLEKGTYYIRIWNYSTSYDVKGKMSVSFSYPQEKKTDENAEGTISCLSVTLKKGDTLQLGAVIDGEGTVKWSTSKKSVAAVTLKGKITAKAKGTATITARLGSSSVKINVKVTQ